jgi:hypothetical protein
MVSTLASYSGHPGCIVCLERFHYLIFHPIISSQIRKWAVRQSNPGRGEVFSTPAQTGREAHPASFPMHNGSFPRVKRLERDVNHPLPSTSDVKERVQLYLYYRSGPLWPVQGKVFLFLSSHVTSVKELRKNSYVKISLI